MVDISKGLKMTSLLAQLKRQEVRETERCTTLITERDAAVAERDALVAAVKAYRQHFEVDPFSPDAALAADIALDEALAACLGEINV